jgi:hypothetical protein
MYRIQAYNLKSKRIEIHIIGSHAEKMLFINNLRDNPDYGAIDVEYNPRGSFYR